MKDKSLNAFLKSSPLGNNTAEKELSLAGPQPCSSPWSQAVLSFDSLQFKRL